MSESTRRNADLPPPLMTSERGSFARRTIVERKPQIIRQVIEDNDYPPGIVQALEAFREEIASQPIRPLNEQAPDVASWNRELAAYRGKTWLEVPWYFAETYFYRRLLEAVRYFQPGQPGPWLEGARSFRKTEAKAGGGGRGAVGGGLGPTRWPRAGSGLRTAVTFLPVG